MKRLLFFSLFACFATLGFGQDYIHLLPEQVDHLMVIGSDNVVIRGDAVKIQPESIAKQVRKSIEDRYQLKVDSLDRLLAAKQIGVMNHERELAGITREKQAAVREAFLLTEEFKTLDLQQGNKRYQLLDSLFRAGDIEGCLAWLNDENLEAEDEKNARNRRIKARLHSVNFEFDKAEANFLASSRIHPTFAAFEALANYYLSTDEMNKLKDALDRGRQLVTSISESLYLEIGYTYLYRNTGEKMAAIAKMEKCDSLMQRSNRPEIEKQEFAAAVQLETAELYRQFPDQQRRALSFAKQGMNAYQELIAENEENIIGFVSAMHIQGKIHSEGRNAADALLIERLALKTLDDYQERLGADGGYQTIYLDVLLMIASIQATQENYEEANLYVNEALSRMDSLYREHPTLGLLSRITSAQYNKANQRMKAKKYQEAIAVYDKAEEKFQQILSVDSTGMNKFDFLGKLYNNRGKCYEYLENESAAQANFYQAHQYFSNRLTPTGKNIYDDNSFNAIMNLANTNYRTGDFRNAAINYKKSLLQISLLYNTEPAYWQGIYLQHILRAGQAHHQLFIAEETPRDFIEACRHLQSAENINVKTGDNEQSAAVTAEIKAAKTALLSLTPLFVARASFDRSEFLARLVLKEELAEGGSYGQLMEAYEGFSREAMDAVLALKSPFHTSVSEHEDEAYRKLYAWWSANLTLGYLHLGKIDKALYAAESALRYWDNDQHKLVLAIVQMLVDQPNDAVKTLKMMEMSGAEKSELLQTGLTVLEKSGALKIADLNLEKVLKKM